MPCIIKYQGKYLAKSVTPIKWTFADSEAVKFSDKENALSICMMLDIPGSIIDAATGEILMHEGMVEDE